MKVLLRSHRSGICLHGPFYFGYFPRRGGDKLKGYFIKRVMYLIPVMLGVSVIT